jgi:hypothetical protein
MDTLQILLVGGLIIPAFIKMVQTLADMAINKHW